jgi:hypothetical protein
MNQRRPALVLSPPVVYTDVNVKMFSATGVQVLYYLFSQV